MFTGIVKRVLLVIVNPVEELLVFVGSVKGEPVLVDFIEIELLVPLPVNLTEELLMLVNLTEEL